MSAANRHKYTRNILSQGGIKSDFVTLDVLHFDICMYMYMLYELITTAGLHILGLIIFYILSFIYFLCSTVVSDTCMLSLHEFLYYSTLHHTVTQNANSRMRILCRFFLSKTLTNPLNFVLWKTCKWLKNYKLQASVYVTYIIICNPSKIPTGLLQIAAMPSSN